MIPNISITLNTPHVTKERYSELTGQPVDTINDMLADGHLPRHRQCRLCQRAVLGTGAADCVHH